MIRPRAVLDTNVLISTLWGGIPRRIIRHWQDGRLKLLISQPILEEYLTVLERFGPAEEDFDTLVTLLGHPHLTEWVVPSVEINLISEDPADNRFLECAAAGRADAIISGDRHLLKLRQYQDIPILLPKLFVQRWFPKDAQG